MEPSQPAPPRPARWPRRPLLVAAGLLAGLLGLGVYFLAWRPGGTPAPDPGAGVPEDPRRTFATPYQNVRPEVAYVGDRACAGCHRRISETYRRHPMGRSLAPVPGGELPAIPDPGVPRSFAALGLHYEVALRDGRLTHRERARDPGGRVIAERAAEVRYVIGSGARGHTYLIEEGGYLFQSPVSWFSARRTWDLSPGYRDRNAHFDRPVGPSCLFCHANGAEPVEHTLNRYRTPVFRGHAVGCERCHGPGELHVRRHRGDEAWEGGADDTIVNPARLEPALREAVCQQCHLQGQARVPRRGRGTFDYRPGLPLHLFWAVFVWHPEVPHGQKAVGHVEEMFESRCYEASAGKLGCVSCHDPHERPDPSHKGTYYRARCLQCHAETSCGLAPAERRKKDRDDACASCHMPPKPTTDVVHVSVTDHRILPRPGAAKPTPEAPASWPGGKAPLVPFHAELAPGKAPDASRDLGLALMELAGQTAPEPLRRHLGELALPLLGQAVRDPADVASREARGQALRRTGRPREALAAYQEVLADVPGREFSLAEAGTLAEQLGRADEAAGYWRRAIAVSPGRWRYHYSLALALSDRSDWDGALAACAAARRLNPVQTDVRLLEAACLLSAGRRAEARTAFEAALALKPPRAEELRRWFDAQLRRR